MLRAADGQCSSCVLLRGYGGVTRQDAPQSPQVGGDALYSIVLQLLRKEFRFFLAAMLAGLALRLPLVLHFPAVVDDSRLYADIAMNWLQYGIYGITDSGQVMPTLSRLPGYPAFLAGVFTVFGWSNFRAVLFTQVAFDLFTCLILADIARRLFGQSAAKAAVMLAALCPFLANYAAAALTETLEIFFTALALDFAVFGLHRLCDETSLRIKYIPWAACGLSIGACILLRPDGGILLAAVGGYLLLLCVRAHFEPRSGRSALFLLRRSILSGLALGLCALACLLPWTFRNFHNLHRFQPLAPRYANDSDELVMTGFNRWTKTWIAEYTSVQEIYWNVPGEAIDVNRLPSRAFDSTKQRQQTAQLFTDYNVDHDVTPELDAQFGALAVTRIHDAPFRYYLWLPALRVADMWLRPRTELFPSDPRWWEFNDDHIWLTVSISFGLLNLAYVVAACAGFRRAREVPGIGLLASFLLLRTLFLGTLENPEPRYTLECYPVIIVFAAALAIGIFHTTNRKPA